MNRGSFSLCILNGFDDFTKAVFAPKCSQNYKNESVLVNHAVSHYILRHYNDT